MWDGAVWPLPPEREGPGVLLQHSHRAGSPPVGLRGVLRELCGTELNGTLKGTAQGQGICSRPRPRLSSAQLEAWPRLTQVTCF